MLHTAFSYVCFDHSNGLHFPSVTNFPCCMVPTPARIDVEVKQACSHASRSFLAYHARRGGIRDNMVHVKDMQGREVASAITSGKEL